MLAEQYLALANEVADIYAAQPALDHEGVAEVLESGGTRAALAMLAASLVPSAFGRVVARQLGVEIADEFQVKNRAGDWISYAFGEHPLGNAALRVATARFVNGPRAAFEAVATRSAEIRALNSALERGLEVKGARLKACQIFGVVAEDLE